MLKRDAEGRKKEARNAVQTTRQRQYNTPNAVTFQKKTYIRRYTSDLELRMDLDNIIGIYIQYYMQLVYRAGP